MFGDRKFRTIGKGFVFEPNKLIYSEFSFGRDKKNVYQTSKKMLNSDIAGGVFRVSKDFMEKLLMEKHKHKF